MAEVSMDYEVVESMANGFQGAADTFTSLNQALETAAGILRASAFVGMVGNLVLARYLENIQPNVTRLAATCEELNADLLGAIASLRDGDMTGSQRFAGGGGGGGASFVGGGSNPGSKAPVASAQIADLSKIIDGKDGWETINMSGDFTPGELVSQTGPSCTIYGTLNMLIENGHDISQADADALYQKYLKDAGIFHNPNIWADMLDGKHEDGFGMHNADAILRQYGAKFKHSDFSTWAGLGSPDRAAAEKFLINQAKAGNPVQVTTQVDDTFGIAKGAHNYTVLGVQTDSNGKLTNVLVATNWGGQQVQQIPANAFMDDWLNYNDGEYIVLTK